MFALVRICRQIFVVEVADPFLDLEAKVLVQHHGRVVDRDVQRDVFTGAGLQQREKRREVVIIIYRDAGTEN